jgi:hypothetical protein
MLKVRTKQTVNFEEGIWGRDFTGDTFAEPIPEGTVIRRRSSGNVGVVFDGGGTASLVFTGSAELQDVALWHFRAPVVASAGSPVLTFVQIGPSESSVTITGTASVQCRNCQFEQPTETGRPLVVVDEHASLELTSVSFDRFNGQLVTAIDVGGDANLVVDGGIFKTDFGVAINAHTNGSVLLRSANFFSSLVTVGADTGSARSTELDSCTSTGLIQLVGPMERVRIRGSKMVSLHLLGSDRTDDLGTLGDPGGNEFSSEPLEGSHLGVMGWGNDIHAVGNEWRPNAQGADARGEYPRLPDGGTSHVVLLGEEGANVSVISDGTDGGGRPPSRVEL